MLKGGEKVEGDEGGGMRGVAKENDFFVCFCQFLGFLVENFWLVMFLGLWGERV